jgi:hypothetical protein
MRKHEAQKAVARLAGELMEGYQVATAESLIIIARAIEDNTISDLNVKIKEWEGTMINPVLPPINIYMSIEDARALLKFMNSEGHTQSQVMDYLLFALRNSLNRGSQSE